MPGSELFALFTSAFVAATLLPAASEVVLGTLITKGEHAPWILVAVAALGNTLGAAVNWALGRFGARFSERRWFPLTPAQYDRACHWFTKYGSWSLLLAWVPIVGDPLTVAAGLLRTNFAWFLLLVGTGKTLRYLVVAWAVLSVAS